MPVTSRVTHPAAPARPERRAASLALTLLSPFHLSTRWILLKSLTPVNTVKSPELELLSCERQHRPACLSLRTGAKALGPGPQAHPFGGRFPFHPEHGGLDNMFTAESPVPGDQEEEGFLEGRLPGWQRPS